MTVHTQGSKGIASSESGESFDFVHIRSVYAESLTSLHAVEEALHAVFYAAIVFLAPFVFTHPQLLVGTIVNAALILGAQYVRGWKLLPVILLPSIGVYVSGLVFGASSLYLIYLIPAIWAGNAIYAYGYRSMQRRKTFGTSKIVHVIGAGVLKSVFIFAYAGILVLFKAIPSLFLVAMGPLQLATAALGGIAAVGVIQARSQLIARSSA